MTKQPRSAFRTTLATRSGGSGESISSVVSAPSIWPWMVSFSTEPSTRIARRHPHPHPVHRDLQHVPVPGHLGSSVRTRARR